MKMMKNIIELSGNYSQVDYKGRKVIAWNWAMETMTGVKKEDMIGRGNYE
jgi:hypothetical protein